MISRVVLLATRIKAPSEAYFAWRKKQRLARGRYFSDDRMNAFHLSMEIGRYRWRQGVAEIDRLNLMSTVSQEFRYKFNKIGWSSFSEALLLFDLYNSFTLNSQLAKLTDCTRSKSNSICRPFRTSSKKESLREIRVSKSFTILTGIASRLQLTIG